MFRSALRLWIVTLVWLCMSGAALADVTGAQRTQGLVAPAPMGAHTLVQLRGSGTFISAQVSKQGGNLDLTFVNLEIDGKNVVSASYAALRNWGLVQDNPYGLVLLSHPTGVIKTATIGFSTPLTFKNGLTLSVTVSEPGVVQILGNVIHGD
jgi:hypothetical protein